MRITIVTLGSRGDVQPYVALGLGLKARGHAVTIITDGSFAEFITQYGLTCVPTSIDAKMLMTALTAAGTNVTLFVQNWRRYLRPLLSQVLDDMWQGCQDAEVIIAGTFGMPAQFMAEKKQIPYFQALLQPVHRTRSFAAPMLPVEPKWGGRVNLVTHTIMEQVAHQSFRPELNRWRQTHGLEPLPPLEWPYQGINGRSVPTLYGFSPKVIPKPADWNEHTHICGYWFLNSIHDWQPPDALTDFLAQKPLPISIGFGSIMKEDVQMLFDILFESLHQTGQRAVLLAGWGQLGKLPLPRNVFKIDSVPHDWLFPRVQAAIHHGGAGTVAAALRAGIPNVIVPFFGDQPFWGRRVYSLGAGPKPINLGRISVEGMVARIETAVSNQAVRQTAQGIGRQIRAENGVETAVNMIESYL